MRALVDVNVVIALIDPRHVFHEAAHRWLATATEWWTCPLVEHGVVRVVTRPTYPNALPTVADALALMERLGRHPRHRRLIDDVRLTDAGVIADPSAVTSPHVTDVHLLALAVRHGLRLATFDGRIPARAVVGGRDALHVIAVR
jgi:toxin-antitoxin system PIN domain toxin